MNADTKVKRVLVFSTAYLPFIGGAEVAVKAITDLNQDYQFDVVTARLNKDLREIEDVAKNVRAYRVGEGNSLIDKYRLALRGHKFAQKLHNENNYDLVWGIMASYGGFAASAFKKNNKDIPFLLTLQEGDPISFIKFRALPLWFAFKNIFRRADYIQAISNYLANWAKEMGATCPVEVVPNGVDNETSALAGHQNSKEQLNNFLPKDGKKIIITTSRLVKKNGVDDIIRAMKFVPADCKLLIIGDGPDKKKLEDLAEKLKLNDRIEFKGSVPHHNIAPYLAISDIFIRPSLSEGLGNSFLEAMAAGVPVIGTRVGGIPDFLTDPSDSLGQVPTGLFCEVNNPKSIAEKVMVYLDDNALRERIITNARRLVQEKYDWGLVANKMKIIFNNLCVS